MTALVKYQIATYSGEVEVSCDPDDDNEYIIRIARAIERRRRFGGSFPFGYESWKVVDRY